jgi:Zn-dependent protease
MTTLILLGIIIIFSISFHEFSHAITAHFLGDDTAKSNGRLTLDPTKHITLTGLLVMLLTQFRFGWGNPTPINPNNLRNPKKDSLLIALAGPMSNIVLSILATTVIYIIFQLHVGNNIAYKLDTFFIYMVIINIGLAIFNLIPIAPLDGSHILPILLKNNYALQDKINKYSIFILIILIIPIIPINGTLESIIQIIISPVIASLYSFLTSFI